VCVFVKLFLYSMIKVKMIIFNLAELNDESNEKMTNGIPTLSRKKCFKINFTLGKSIVVFDFR